MCECDSDLVTVYLGSSFVIIQQECEVSMWILADGPVSLSDGVCAFLGNGLGLFFVRKE